MSQEVRLRNLRCRSGLTGFSGQTSTVESELGRRGDIGGGVRVFWKPPGKKKFPGAPPEAGGFFFFGGWRQKDRAELSTPVRTAQPAGCIEKVAMGEREG